YNGKEERFYSEKERHDFFTAHNLYSPFEPAPSPIPDLANTTSDLLSTVLVSSTQPVTPSRVREIELHEVKVLNKHLIRLRDDFGLSADVLLPHEVTGEDPPPRFLLSRGNETYPLLDLRALIPNVRKIGEKGMKITRFKGLGEMDAEQLWETTMDPTR